MVTQDHTSILILFHRFIQFHQRISAIQLKYMLLKENKDFVGLILKNIGTFLQFNKNK